MRVLSTIVAASLFILACGGATDEEGVKDVSGQETAGGDKCLKFEYLSGHFEPPSNIVVLFGLETCEGKPKPGVKAEQFVVGEDVAGISVEAEAVVLPTEMGFRLFSVLLLDMSGSIAVSGDVGKLKTAAKKFLTIVESSHEVLIFTFDGRDELQPLLPTEGGIWLGQSRHLDFPNVNPRPVVPWTPPFVTKAIASATLLRT